MKSGGRHTGQSKSPRDKEKRTRKPGRPKTPRDKEKRTQKPGQSKREKTSSAAPTGKASEPAPKAITTIRVPKPTRPPKPPRDQRTSKRKGQPTGRTQKTITTTTTISSTASSRKERPSRRKEKASSTEALKITTVILDRGRTKPTLDVTRTFKTSLTSMAVITSHQPNETKPTPITIPILGLDITDIVEEVRRRFDELDDAVKYGGAAFIALIVLFCCYRIFCIRARAAPKQHFTVVLEEKRHRRRFPHPRTRSSSTTESRARSRDSTSYVREQRHRRREEDRGSPDRTRFHGRTTETVERVRRTLDRRRKSHEDRQQPADAPEFRAQTAPTMEGTMATTDETMQSVDGSNVPMSFPPPPPPPGAPVGRVARNLKNLLRRSYEENKMGKDRATTSNILDMMGNIPEEMLEEAPSTTPTGGGTPSAPTPAAPGYEELATFNKELLKAPPVKHKRS